jgi:hypothetical protein
MVSVLTRHVFILRSIIYNFLVLRESDIKNTVHKAHKLTSVPAWRETPCDEKNINYLDFKQFRLCKYRKFPKSCISHILRPLLNTPDPVWIVGWKSGRYAAWLGVYSS